MIYKKHILSESDFSSHIHTMYIQLAKKSIEYKVVGGKRKRLLIKKLRFNKIPY